MLIEHAVASKDLPVIRREGDDASVNPWVRQKPCDLSVQVGNLRTVLGPRKGMVPEPVQPHGHSPSLEVDLRQQRIERILVLGIVAAIELPRGEVRRMGIEQMQPDKGGETALELGENRLQRLVRARFGAGGAHDYVETAPESAVLVGQMRRAEHGHRAVALRGEGLGQRQRADVGVGPKAGIVAQHLGVPGMPPGEQRGVRRDGRITRRPRRLEEHAGLRESVEAWRLQGFVSLGANEAKVIETVRVRRDEQNGFWCVRGWPAEHQLRDHGHRAWLTRLQCHLKRIGSARQLGEVHFRPAELEVDREDLRGLDRTALLGRRLHQLHTKLGVLVEAPIPWASALRREGRNPEPGRGARCRLERSLQRAPRTDANSAARLPSDIHEARTALRGREHREHRLTNEVNAVDRDRALDPDVERERLYGLVGQDQAGKLEDRGMPNTALEHVGRRANLKPLIRRERRADRTMRHVRDHDQDPVKRLEVEGPRDHQALVTYAGQPQGPGAAPLLEDPPRRGDLPTKQAVLGAQMPS